MFEEKVKYIIQEKYTDLMNNVISIAKQLPLDTLPADLEIPFDNVWDAFVDQLRCSDDDLYPLYADLILDICQQAIHSLTFTEVKLLWLGSEGYLEWDEEEDFPEAAQIASDVIEELMSWVEQEAEDPEFEEEDDYDDEDYQDDDTNETRH